MPALLFTLTLACADPNTADSGSTAPLDPAARVEQLAAPGAWSVGYTEQALQYTDPAGQPRELRLAAWYPSPDTDGEGVSYLGIVQDELSWRDAAVAEGPFPVLLMSHGSQGYAEAMGMLARHFASHGWLVLSPDHTDNLITDDARTTEIYFQRPADLSAVLDHASTQWAGVADLDRVVGLGHSFGGYTLHALTGARYAIEELAPACYDGSDTSNFCSTMSPDYEAIFAAGLVDPRVKSLISVGSGDLRLFGEAGIAGIDRPGLWLNAELEGAAAEGEQLQAWLQGPEHRRAVVLGANHNWIIDLSAALDLDASLPTEDGWRIARVLSLAWALKQSEGDDTVDPILQGEVEIDAAVLWTERGV